MSTIESLDLAWLTNNPQSIAEALEDVLETTSGNIGSLKTSAQDDHDHIEDLRSSAQTDYDNLFGSTNSEHAEYETGFLNSWEAFNYTTSTGTEDGIRVFRLGIFWTKV